MACREAFEFCSGKTENDFYHDRGLNLIIHKLIEIVGEALHQAELIEPEAVYGIPEFRLIVNARNRIAHGYESVDYGLLWTIVQEKLPGLEQTLTTMLSNADIDDEA